MTKNEYIAKYGEERYRQHLSRMRERMRDKYRNKVGTNGREKSTPYYRTKFFAPIPENKEGLPAYKFTEYLSQRAEELAFHFQRMLKRQWVRDCVGDSIIIVEPRTKKDGYFRFKAELYLPKAISDETKRWFDDSILNLQYEE